MSWCVRTLSCVVTLFPVWFRENGGRDVYVWRWKCCMIVVCALVNA